MDGVPASATSDRDWLPTAASLCRLSEVVAAMLLDGEESGSESESESLSSSGQSRSAETFVCLPLGPFTHVVFGFLRRHVNSALRVTSCTAKQLSSSNCSSSVRSSGVHKNHVKTSRDVKSSRPTWRQGQIFGPRPCSIWPRPCPYATLTSFSLRLASW